MKIIQLVYVNTFTQVHMYTQTWFVPKTFLYLYVKYFDYTIKITYYNVCHLHNGKIGNGSFNVIIIRISMDSLMHIWHFSYFSKSYSNSALTCYEKYYNSHNPLVFPVTVTTGDRRKLKQK